MNSLQAFFNGLGIFGPLFFLLTTWWLHHYLRMRDAQIVLSKVLGERAIQPMDEALPSRAHAVARLEAILDKMHGISGQLPSWGLVGTAAGVFFVLARSSGLGDIEPGELMTFLLDGGLAVALVSTFAGQLNYLILNGLYTWRDSEEVLRLLILAEEPALKSAQAMTPISESEAMTGRAEQGEEHWELNLDDETYSMRQTQPFPSKVAVEGGL